MFRRPLGASAVSYRVVCAHTHLSKDPNVRKRTVKLCMAAREKT
jgi:hypothetical protein